MITHAYKIKIKTGYENNTVTTRFYTREENVASDIEKLTDYFKHNDILEIRLKKMDIDDVIDELHDSREMIN